MKALFISWISINTWLLFIEGTDTPSKPKEGSEARYRISMDDVDLIVGFDRYRV